MSHLYRSDTTSEGGLVAASEYFKGEQERLEKKIEGLKVTRSELEAKIQSLELDKKNMNLQVI